MRMGDNETIGSNVSTSFIVSFDIAHDDSAILTVVRKVGTRFELVNTIIGEDAISIYEQIMKGGKL